MSRKKINSIWRVFMEFAAVRIRHVDPHGKTAPMAQKNAAAVSLGRKGGKATARNRTPEERAEAARKAVKARWAKQEKLPQHSAAEALK
jgi:general stress protein YciG